MATKVMDLKGLKCPQPSLKMTLEMSKMAVGDIIEAVADCPTFEADVKNLCTRSKKVLLWIREEGSGTKRCQVKI